MIPILYLSHSGSIIGGGEKQLFYLVTHLDKNTYQPFVVCPDEGVFAQHLRDANIPTFVLNLPQWRKMRNLFTRQNAATKLVHLTKKHKIQLIHTSDSWMNPYLCHVKQHVNIPVISHVRNILTPTQIKKYSFNHIDHIIAISDQSKIPLIYSGLDSEKIDVILNCVDLTQYKPTPVKLQTKSSLFVVGLVGRIEPFKNQKTFIEIASHVIKQGRNIRFHIIGSALNTPRHKAYEQEVRQLVTKYKLEDAVHFLGHRNDMPNVLQDLDVLVTLSAGSVIAEAMASGKPVIGTPIGSTTDMIVDGVTGWVIPIDPSEGIADRIIQLYDNRELCIQMGTAARKHAETTFSIKEHVNMVQDVYKKLLNQF